ncbi:MAG: protease complex subunit PrcB family protein [Pseudomonadota bacterium]
MRGRIRAASAVVCTALLGGCHSAQPVQSQELLNHHACVSVSAGVAEVALSDLSRIRGSRLLQLGNGTADQDLPELSTATRLFVVSRGEMPTPGYRFEVAAVTREAEELVIDLTWTTPPADSVLPQVLTHPCVVLALPVNGATTVVARSEDAELGRLALTAQGAG